MSAQRKVLLPPRALLAVRNATSAESGDTLPATALRAALAAMVEVHTVAAVAPTEDSRVVVALDSVDPDRLLATLAVDLVT